MQTKYIYLLILFITACEKETITIENLNGNKIGIIGHGGCGFHGLSNPYPNDSYSGIVRGINAYHAEGSEVDLQLSSDQVIYLFHDPVLENSTDYAGCVYQFDSAALSKCQFKNNYSFQKEYLVTLEKIFSVYQNSVPQPFIFLDVRTEVSCGNLVNNPDAYEEIMAEKINTLIVRYDYTDNVFVEGTSWRFLDKVKTLNPSLHLIYQGQIDLPTIQKAVAANLYGLLSKNNNTTKEDVSLAHQYNLRVVLFDVKSFQSQSETVQKNPDFIETDRILLLQRILN